ncbi:MAG: hypothetical protein GC200_11835 [Tepidisphaera sp.]|nr:hypothetical protein [Tepidisphaera sp.]
MNLTPSALLEVFGRLHPVMLHLPIGLVTAIAGIEGWRLVSRDPACPHAPRVLGVLAGASALLAALMGLTLARDPAYTSESIFWHQYLGIAFALCVLVMSVLLIRADHARSAAPTLPGINGRDRAYLLALLMTLGVMVPTGHLGGEISHGEGFITQPLTRRPAHQDSPPRVGATPDARAETPLAHADVPPEVQAIFDSTCVSCHGPNKQKGGLRLDTSQGLWDGSDAGAVVVPGDPNQSELTYRMALPLSDEDHMPPKGKPQPTTDQISTVGMWIAGLKKGV